MKYLLSLISVLTVTLFTALAFGFNPPPAPTEGYVVDKAGKLSTVEVSNLNNKIEAVKTSTSNEIGILILSSLEGETIEDVTQDTFNSWKIGKAGLDNGVLLVLAIQDRKIRIQTGKGVEGDLTDVQSNDIINKMKPALRSGNFSGALGLAVDQIGSTIESRKGNPQILVGSEPMEPVKSYGFIWALLALPLLGGIFFAVFLLFRNKREEKELSSFRNTYTPPAPKSSYTPSYSLPSTSSVAVSSASSSTKKRRSSSSSSYSSSSSSSSYTPSSSYSSPDYSSGGSSGGGFGGGSSGGGGASGDW